MAIMEIESYVQGMTNTWHAVEWVNSNGVACPVKIQTSGHGKYATGHALINSADYPDGVYRISISNGNIDIDYYSTTCGVQPFQDYRLAPEKVQDFAEQFAVESNCYHCRCLDRHLTNCSQ